MRSNFKSYFFSIFVFLSIISIFHIIEFQREVIVDREAFDAQDADVKVILSWNPFFGDSFYGFGEGVAAFERHGCEHRNCLITGDKLQLPQHRFHAVVFHGFEFYEVFYGKPRHRSAEQYYVFMSLESARRAEIPFRMRHFYNLTMTYRLDSDIPWPYFRVRDANGEIIAPAESEVRWRVPSEPPADLLDKIRSKTRKIAWFVSNCDSTNGREKYVAELREHIEVDVFGACGERSCPVGDGRCLQMLRDEYHFYLAFENSHCEDYITEKVLTALNSDTVPIVYGYVKLSRFLPPQSYIDANEFSPKDLAAKVQALIDDKQKYVQYLWWKDKYRYEKSMPADAFPTGTHPFCALCRMLNERIRVDAERDLHRWWMGNGTNPRCVR